jgi:hypothetical protein
LACKIRQFALMQNKQIKPVLFASKQIYIFAYICFEPNLWHTLEKFTFTETYFNRRSDCMASKSAIIGDEKYNKQI